jgi:MoaE-MoaD fusion protein
MRVLVQYFAAARERAGTDREEIELTTPTVAALEVAVAARHPGLAPLLPRLRFAVNRAFAPSSASLKEDDEIALIPPVAGGAGRFSVTEERLSLPAAVEAVAGPAHGAIVSFTGTVRGDSHGRQVQRLEYEAYAAMALTQLQAIATAVEERWPGVRVAIHHRVGVLQVGDEAVVIAAAAPHRREAFRACEEAIELLKKDVPIWKKEIFEDGAQWVGLGP